MCKGREVSRPLENGVRLLTTKAKVHCESSGKENVGVAAKAQGESSGKNFDGVEWEQLRELTKDVGMFKLDAEVVNLDAALTADNPKCNGDCCREKIKERITMLKSMMKMMTPISVLVNGFVLEKSFRTTHAILLLHMWLTLVRLCAEGKDGAKVGQTIYELFNHDLERRIVAAGVKMLISKWMKELEKKFYGAVQAYDEAMKPSAPKDDLARALWRHAFTALSIQSYAK